MIRVAIADDHTVVRQGLKHMIESDPELTLVGQAVDGLEVMALVRQTEMDVLILDVSMPGRSGIELLSMIKSERAKLPVLILSMHHEDQFAVRAIKAGALGYLTKGCETAEMIHAIKKISTGSPYITSAVAERLALEVGTLHSGDQLHKTLSDREFQIFKLLVDGLSVAGIAQSLCISNKTVSTYKTRILQKMNFSSTSDLIHYAIDHGLSNRR